MRTDLSITSQIPNYLAQINSLPVEILTAIFSETLGLKDILSASLVCKSWKEICSSQNIWKKLIGNRSLVINDQNLKKTNLFKAYLEHNKNIYNIAYGICENDINYEFNLGKCTKITVLDDDIYCHFSGGEFIHVNGWPQEYHCSQNFLVKANCLVRFNGELYVGADDGKIYYNAQETILKGESTATQENHICYFERSIDNTSYHELLNDDFFKLDRSIDFAVTALVVFNDQLISGDNDGCVRLFDNNFTSKIIYHHPKKITALTIFKNYLVSGSIDGVGHVREYDSPIVEKYQFDSIIDLATTSNEIISLSRFGEINFWLTNRTLYSSTFTSITTLGNYVMGGRDDGGIEMIDENFNTVRVLLEHCGSVKHLSIVGNQLISADDKTLLMWSFMPPIKENLTNKRRCTIS
ncbi:MAG: F-box-like domain-containing protein [Parachlamydiales bacterium]|nr:F-box-like domain-containing protein [Parachlamydiales bacterium]